mgnify:CR=1 FL=1
MSSTYQITQALLTSCPCESHHVYLLVDTEPTSKRPAFDICRDCLRIGEVGVGPVKASLPGTSQEQEPKP